MPDGTVGCIDYGQVKRLTTQERHWLCRCYVALARGDDKKLRELADLVGMRSRYMLDVTRQKMLTFALDRDGRDVTDGLNFQQFLDKMYALDPWDVPGGVVRGVSSAGVERGSARRSCENSPLDGAVEGRSYRAERALPT